MAKVDSMGGVVEGNSGTAAVVRTVTVEVELALAVEVAVEVAVAVAVVATILDRMEATKVGLLLRLPLLKVNRSLWKVG